MDVREHDLPGVGKKFALKTNEGDRMTIIIHNTGHREIYHFLKGEDYPDFAIRLEDSEARKLGAILGGAYFQPPVAESMEMVLDQLSIEWLKVDPGSALADQTIQEAAIRERTGASIIAILRDGKAHPNPQPSDRIATGDTLMVVGDREQVARFAGMCKGAYPGPR
ncbi:MAG TPA: cation:proton antiporter regulatory subunit [Longimicrobiaceae bacterium]|nr:cation:proton antiporter regulatory subunit [Longimicrobiaceae bacterium]